MRFLEEVFPNGVNILYEESRPEQYKKCAMDAIVYRTLALIPHLPRVLLAHSSQSPYPLSGFG